MFAAYGEFHNILNFGVHSCKFVSTDLALDSRCYFECVQALSIIVSDISLVQHYDCFENIIQYFLAVVDGSKGM